MALWSKRRRHAGIHPAAQSENDPFAAHLRLDFLHRLIDVMAHGPVLAAAADAMDEIGNDLAAVRRVGDFGMELQAEKFAVAVLDGGELRIVGGGDGFEAVRRSDQFVPVRIPDLQGVGQIGEEGGGGIGDQKRAFAIFAFWRRAPTLPPRKWAINCTP